MQCSVVSVCLIKLVYCHVHEVEKVSYVESSDGCIIGQFFKPVLPHPLTPPPPLIIFLMCIFNWQFNII